MTSASVASAGMVSGAKVTSTFSGKSRVESVTPAAPPTRVTVTFSVADIA